MSASAGVSRNPVRRAAAATATRLPWLVDAYRFARNPRWELDLRRDLQATRDNAHLMQRAYSLGEADLQTLLLARRQALDASTAAEQARAEALRWHYRLLVDAHLIWALGED